MRDSRRTNGLLLALLSTIPAVALAQDLEPRAYSNLPIGMNFLVAGYGYSEGGLSVDPALPLTDGELRVHTAVIAYARSVSVLGMAAKVDAVLPYSWLSGEATFAGAPRERNVDGFNDPRFRFTLNFHGAPALSMAEFADYRQALIVGASVQVVPPLGQYDASKAVNLGTNRWSIKPELGLSKAWGPLILELAPSVTFYTKNDDFLNGNRREQAPLYAVQGHLVYSIGGGIWASVDSTYQVGGRTTLNGVKDDDRLKNWRLGATLSLPIDRRYSVELYGSTGVASERGADFDSVGIAWQYRWGAGL